MLAQLQLPPGFIICHQCNVRPHLIDFMFHGSGGSDFCSLQKKKSGRAPAHAYVRRRDAALLKEEN